MTFAFYDVPTEDICGQYGQRYTLFPIILHDNAWVSSANNWRHAYCTFKGKIIQTQTLHGAMRITLRVKKL